MDILIWGTGRLAGKVVGKHVALADVRAFVDNDKAKAEYMGKPVVQPEKLSAMHYDAILVANLFREQIEKQCRELGIPMERVIFLYENCVLSDVNKDYRFVESVVGEAYAERIKNRYRVIRTVEPTEELCLSGVSGGYMDTDYVRMKSFELAVKEIRKREVPGAVAEAGVFRGEFAQYINIAFPERKLYLFDTFDGFDANEALSELKSGNCTEAFVKAYKETNIGTVLSRMRSIENIVIKQGFFPQSLGGMEDTFAFVSLDMDFEESIYEGLRYFYPRLNRGGYIFVHDYTSELRGVEQAVDRYERETGCPICKVPLCDHEGTLVIAK